MAGWSGVRKVASVFSVGMGVLALSLILVVTVTTPAAAFGREIDPLPTYEPQRTCSQWAKPGTKAFADYLMRSYPGTGTSGIVRECHVGGRSEHKEGRAFDWKVDYTNPRQRAQAEAFLAALFATDRYGNRYALARRMGVMYAIWNRQVFYLDRPGWRAYHGVSPHRDHVHFSLTWAGALGQTSFYTGSTHKIRPASAVTGDSPRILPTRRVIPRPEIPAARTDGMALRRARVRVSATDPDGVLTSSVLQAGVRYQLRVRGRYFAGPGYADAECSTPPANRPANRRVWNRLATSHGQPDDYFDLYLDGRDPELQPLRALADQPLCAVAGRYHGTFVPRRTSRVRLALWGVDPLHSRGAVTIDIVRDRVRR